ncbi:MAG: phosphatidylglycerophosphatase A, partial [Planctomycetota bacterium]
PAAEWPFTVRFRLKARLSADHPTAQSPDRLTARSPDRPITRSPDHRAPADRNPAPVLWKAVILTAGGLGHLRPAPGTWGTLPPCAIVLLMAMLGVDAWIIHATLFVVLVAACVACVALGSWGEQHWQAKDPGVIVIDEVAGMALGLLLVPLPVLAAVTEEAGTVAATFARSISDSLAVIVSGPGTTGPVTEPDGAWLLMPDPSGLAGLVAVIGFAFVLFRIFDIVKAPPANVVQQLPSGWGVLLDDLIAGLYTNLVLQIFLRLALPLLTTTTTATTTL